MAEEGVRKGVAAFLGTAVIGSSGLMGEEPEGRAVRRNLTPKETRYGPVS